MFAGPRRCTAGELGLPLRSGLRYRGSARSGNGTPFPLDSGVTVVNPLLTTGRRK
jgi:hypothetical protein